MHNGDDTSQYGKAEYVKIDIEGNDRFCLQSMRTDQYPRLRLARSIAVSPVAALLPSGAPAPS
jgi:hypothetical protein